MVYVFDTNSIEVISNYYPDTFPAFWERFEDAVSNGAVVSVREVFNELENRTGHKWIWDWAKRNKEMFLIPQQAELEFVGRIFRVRHFLALVGEQQRLTGQPVADPFIIACAAVRNGCVVTEEKLKENAAKIPNVCQHFNVEYTDVKGFLVGNNWKF